MTTFSMKKFIVTMIITAVLLVIFAIICLRATY